MTKALNEEFISQLMLKCSVVTELEEQVLLAIREKTNQAQVFANAESIRDDVTNGKRISMKQRTDILQQLGTVEWYLKVILVKINEEDNDTGEDDTLHEEIKDTILSQRTSVCTSQPILNDTSNILGREQRDDQNKVKLPNESTRSWPELDVSLHVVSSHNEVRPIDVVPKETSVLYSPLYALPPYSLDTSRRLNGFVTSITSPSLLWIQIVSNTLDYVVSAVGDFSTQVLPNNLDRVELGMIVLARYSEDSSLYRAKIIATDVNHEIKPVASVLFLDYGNREDDMTLDHFYPLPTNLHHIPPQAFPCVSNRVCPISWDGAWSDEAMSFTSNRLFNKEVEVELIDEDYDILFAELYVDGVKFSNILTKFQHAERCDNSDALKIVCKHFEYFNSQRKGQEMLDEEHIHRSSLPRLSNRSFASNEDSSKPNQVVDGSHNLQKQTSSPTPSTGNRRIHDHSQSPKNSTSSEKHNSPRESMAKVLKKDVQETTRHKNRSEHDGGSISFLNFPTASHEVKTHLSTFVEQSKHVLKEEDSESNISRTRSVRGSWKKKRSVHSHCRVSPQHDLNIDSGSNAMAASSSASEGYSASLSSIDSHADQASDNNCAELILTTKEQHNYSGLQQLKVPASNQFKVMQSGIRCPNDFYVHVACKAVLDTLDRLQVEIGATCNSQDEGMLEHYIYGKDRRVGGLYAAPYQGTYYRALAVDAKYRNEELQQMNVRFVDYGNSAWVDASRIRALPRQFHALPPMAVRCTLSGITHKDNAWTDRERGRFQQLIGSHSSQLLLASLYNVELAGSVITTTQHELLQVQLLNCEDLDEPFCVRSLLLQENIGVAVDLESNSQQVEEPEQASLKNWDPMSEDFHSSRNKPSLRDDDVEVAFHGREAVDDSRVCEKFRLGRCPHGDKCRFDHPLQPLEAETGVLAYDFEHHVVLPPDGVKVLADVSTVVSPSQVVLMLVYGDMPLKQVKHIYSEGTLTEESLVDQLGTLHRDMNLLYNNTVKTDDNFLFAMGEIVAAKWEHQWWRCRVVDIDDEDPKRLWYKVYHVDTGTMSRAAHSDTRKLKQKFMDLPFCAVQCSLNIQPLNGRIWPDSSFKRFSELVKYQPLAATFISRVKEACFVDLQYCDGRTETVSEIMIAEGIAKVGML